MIYEENLQHFNNKIALFENPNTYFIYLPKISFGKRHIFTNFYYRHDIGRAPTFILQNMFIIINRIVIASWKFYVAVRFYWKKIICMISQGFLLWNNSKSSRIFYQMIV